MNPCSVALAVIIMNLSSSLRNQKIYMTQFLAFYWTAAAYQQTGIYFMWYLANLKIIKDMADQFGTFNSFKYKSTRLVISNIKRHTFPADVLPSTDITLTKLVLKKSFIWFAKTMPTQDSRIFINVHLKKDFFYKLKKSITYLSNASRG